MHSRALRMQTKACRKGIIGAARCGSLSIVALLIALGCAGGAWAAGDPTEASPVWVAAQPPAPGAQSEVAGGAPPAEMKMTLIGRSRKLAVIDGEVVKVGSEFRGSKVVAVKADKVVMEDAAKSLGVTPNVEKKAPTLTAARKKLVVVPAGSPSSKAIRE